MGMIYRQKGRTVWMLKYDRDGRPIVESSGTDVKDEARDTLKLREAAIVKGAPVTNRSGRVRFEDLAADIVNEYKANGRRSLGHLERRIALHLRPDFGGRRASTITTSDIRAYIASRQVPVVGDDGTDRPGASNAEINRELAALKRMYTLAVQAEKLQHRPHIPMLEEHNVRKGFFERDQFEAVRTHLPTDLQHVATVAYLTGWRVPSEVLTLQWSQVDFKAGVVRLEPDSTKNDDGRTFPFDPLPELQEALETQRRLKPTDRICPWVFQRGGEPFLDKEGAASKSFRAAWRAACTQSGYPERIPHDFRRTAVRNLVRAGVPEKVAMQLTGHKTRSVFDRYDIVNETDLRRAVTRLATAAAPAASPKRGRVLNKVR